MSGTAARVDWRAYKDLVTEVTRSGSYFFAPDSLAYWHTRPEHGPVAANDGAKYLITSDTVNPAVQPRRYTLRRLVHPRPGEPWTVKSVGTYARFETIDDALDALEQVIRAD